jgi:hypothetical protein
MLPKLNLPSFDLTIKKIDQELKVFDSLRRKYVLLTPEEWVRQNFIRYMQEYLDYPAGLIAVEYGFKLNRQQKRGDIVVFNKKKEPVLVVECKASHVKINQQVFDQIARYNMTLQVPYLVVTNGLKHYCCFIDYQHGKYDFLRQIPLRHQIV